MKKLFFIFLFLPFFVFGQITINKVKKNKKQINKGDYSFNVSSGFLLDSYNATTYSYYSLYNYDYPSENFISFFFNPSLNYNYLIFEKMEFVSALSLPISFRENKTYNSTQNEIASSYKVNIEFNIGVIYKINKRISSSLHASTVIFNSSDSYMYAHDGGGNTLKLDYLLIGNLSSFISISRKRRINKFINLFNNFEIDNYNITQLTLGINLKL